MVKKPKQAIPPKNKAVAVVVGEGFKELADEADSIVTDFTQREEEIIEDIETLKSRIANHYSNIAAIEGELKERRSARDEIVADLVQYREAAKWLRKKAEAARS